MALPDRLVTRRPPADADWRDSLLVIADAIALWRGDDERGYTDVIDLVCEVEEELRRLAAGGPPSQTFELSTVMRAIRVRHEPE